MNKFINRIALILVIFIASLRIIAMDGELPTLSIELTDESAPTLGDILEKNKTSTKLIIDCKKLNNTELIMDALKGNKTIKILEIRDASSFDGKSISEIIKFNKTLKILDIHKASIGWNDAELMIKALKENYCLVGLYLHITYDYLGQDIVSRMKQYIERNIDIGATMSYDASVKNINNITGVHLLFPKHRFVPLHPGGDSLWWL